MLRLLRDVGVPLWLKTAAASGTAAAWRIFLTPVDTVKVIMQVEGSAGREVLRRKLADRGFFALYDGAASSAAATAAAHWPWFLVRCPITLFQLFCVCTVVALIREDTLR